jgi:hypothetical protein
MKLSDFVADTLRQILDGVVEAQRHSAEVGAAVMPDRLEIVDLRHSQTRPDPAVTRVDFDVEIVSTESQGTKGGVGVVVGPVALGSRGESGSEGRSTNRVRFSVPVILPRQSLTNGD